MPPPRFSVVINTDNRAASLALTLDALRYLDHPSFEVVVVRGPTEDATEETLSRYEGVIKVGRCPERNLSMSRNLGVALASGDFVAFIDDDAYPDPSWLDRLEEGFDDPEVAAVGGPVWDWTGAGLQVLYSMADRLGEVWIENEFGFDPSYVLSRPGTTLFTYPIGTNAAFRRRRIVEVGGFDEHFDYGWDEVDLCHRLIERGYVVRVIEDGFVYHKFLPSEIRGENRATHNMGVLLKNKAYYAYRHGWGVVPLSEIATSLATYAQHYRDEISRNVEAGRLTEHDLEQYEADVAASFDRGYAMWKEGRDRRRQPAWFDRDPSAFRPFPTLRARADKLHLCFLSSEYPPAPVNGIGRIVHELATGLGQRGHEVHVLTASPTWNRVDFEDGVWVHRIVPRPHPRPEGVAVTQGLWDYAASMRDEIGRIDAHRPVDLVQAPNWSTEGIAVLLEGRLPLVVGLYTPLATVAAVDTPLAEGVAAGDPEVPTLIGLERFTYRHARHFLACGPSVVQEIEEAYGVRFDPASVGYVPHGIEDRQGLVEPEHWEGRVEVLFVGRLEDRKGIDTLLATLPRLVRDHPEIGFTIVGDDTRPMADGRTHRQRFEASAEYPAVAGNVRFLGRVDDEQLYRHYAGCDVFVAPSRFESFGLVLLEAMMFAKPVVACAVGGMAEIVAHGETGFLVPPGDTDALGEAIGMLVSSPERRSAFGRASRERFVRLYRKDAMVEGVNRFFDTILGRSTTVPVPLPAEPAAPAAEPGPPERPASPPAAELQVTSPAGPALAGLPENLLGRLACPRCASPVEIDALTRTVAGSVKTAIILCPRDGVVGAVENFKVDFLLDPAEAGSRRREQGPTRVIPDLGERRIPAAHGALEAEGNWQPDGAGGLVSPGVIGDTLIFEGAFSDLLVRMRRDVSGGVVDIAIDGVPVTSVDLYQAEGSQDLAVPVATDLAPETRRVSVTARGAAADGSLGRQVHVLELVLYGPLGQGFSSPEPLNRGNPYSPYLERWLADIGPGEPVLEFGGGDRRRCQRGHLNLEYLKFELADGYADIHAIPFADDTFAATWTQAVFEHIDDPFRAASELIRVTRPGGLVMTEVAFMQPLHAVPFHYFNMTPWAVRELFSSCEILECDWFGEISATLEWLLRSVNLAAKVEPGEFGRLLEQLRSYDRLVSHEELRAAASAVYVVARKPA